MARATIPAILWHVLLFQPYYGTCYYSSHIMAHATIPASSVNKLTGHDLHEELDGVYLVVWQHSSSKVLRNVSRDVQLAG